MQDTRTEIRKAFLSVYELNRCYGGPEEGGWWYDTWEHTGASFPFLARVTFYAVEARGEDDDGRTFIWYDEESKEYYKWVPQTIEPVDDEQRSRLEIARMQFAKLYGEPDGRHRFSMAPRGDDFAFVTECFAGEKETTTRPRYE